MEPPEPPEEQRTFASHVVTDAEGNELEARITLIDAFEFVGVSDHAEGVTLVAAKTAGLA